MRGGGFPARAAQGLSLLLYSPGSHGGHIKWPPARAELATNLTPVPPGPGIRRARWGNVPCQKGTGLFWSVLSGEMSPSSVDLLSSVAWKSAVFGSMRQIMNLPSTQGFCDIKPAGRPLELMRRGRPIGILPHTSENRTNIARFNRPFNAKWAASPSRKQPQILRIDNGKGFRRFGAPC